MFMKRVPFRKSIAVLGAATFLSLMSSQAAQAGYLPAFEGFSVFGNNDSGGTTNTCPLCDSTVSFAVWENTDGNWFDDLVSPVDLSGTSSGAEQYVYMYQVFNTDPMNVQNQPLENFNISYGPAGTANPFLSGGYFNQSVFQNASTALTPLDTPNDGSPSALQIVNPIAVDVNAVNPSTLTIGSFLMSHPGVDSGNPYEGALYQFGSTALIPAGGTSSILFLTSNHAPAYSWAESESPGGFGAPGDVPSPVPAPATLSLMLVGLGMVAAARRRTRRSNRS